jgi:putative ABC transport system substrate-binding protein
LIIENMDPSREVVGMRRREFIALVGGAAAGWTCGASTQQPPKITRIGVLSPGLAAVSTNLAAFRHGLHELGYNEGQNLAIELRYGEWKLDLLRDLAAELTARNVDLILAASTPAALAAKQVTSTIPIVAVAMGDPIVDGLVASLASPGGNITGTTFLGPELVAKRLQLLRDAVHGISRLAALWHPGAYGEGTMRDILKETEVGSRKWGVQLQLLQVSGPNDFDGAFSAMMREHADALVVLPSVMLFGEHKRIVALAAQNRLPAMYQAREFVDAGGLMSYGANLPELFRRSAIYVDKILKGTKPADLPVEQPTKFELLVNLKTARELGLTMPREFLLLADEVIE